MSLTLAGSELVNAKIPFKAYAALIAMTFAFGLSFVSTKFALRGSSRC